MSRITSILLLGVSWPRQLSMTLAQELFECPKHIDKAQNEIDGYFEFFDEHNAQHQKSLEGFRGRSYGGRATTFNIMKDATRRFKKKYFGDFLQNGDIFFESACGEGFNTLMTVEHLRARGITNVTAYGSDYLEVSVAVANAVFRKEVPDWEGKFCQGDSTNLSFIPDATFDLAYTGAIDTIIDPLRLYDDTKMSLDDKVKASKRLCQSNDRKDRELAQVEQKAQEDWHSLWVKELLRIVKPGKMVIIEDVAYPYCNGDKDSEWGGVPVEFWLEGVKKYGWNTNVESLVITLHPWYYNRYCVNMRRNPESDPNKAQDKAQS